MSPVAWISARRACSIASVAGAADAGVSAAVQRGVARPLSEPLLLPGSGGQDSLQR